VRRDSCLCSAMVLRQRRMIGLTRLDVLFNTEGRHGPNREENGIHTPSPQR
jgi:hypothetical protein